MDHASTLAAALVMGILGSAHCAGMCGGLACAIVVGPAAGEAKRSALRAARDVVLYNAGRIASYAIAGALAGLAGTAFAVATAAGADSSAGAAAAPGPIARTITAFVTGAFLVIVGIHLGGWATPLGALERTGAKIWRRIQPLIRPLIPATHAWQIAALGMLWGWIPCGLVYSALVLAALSAAPTAGALHMIVFGLGTLPVVAGIGLSGRWISEMGGRSWVGRGAGAMMILLGAATITFGFGGDASDHEAHAFEVERSRVGNLQ